MSREVFVKDFLCEASVAVPFWYIGRGESARLLCTLEAFSMF